MHRTGWVCRIGDEKAVTHVPFTGFLALSEWFSLTTLKNMNAHSQNQSPQTAVTAVMAKPLVLWGYPLLEVLRTCQVQSNPEATPAFGRGPFGMFHGSDRPWTHEDRDIVTPSCDLDLDRSFPGSTAHPSEPRPVLRGATDGCLERKLPQRGSAEHASRRCGLVADSHRGPDASGN